MDCERASASKALKQAPSRRYEVVVGDRLPPGADGKTRGRETRGLLQRRIIEVQGVIYIGKESNRQDGVRHGLVHDPSEVQERHLPSEDQIWRELAVPILHLLNASDVARKSRVSIRETKYLRNTLQIPSAKVRRRILKALAAWAQTTYKNARARATEKEMASRLLDHVAGVDQ